MVLLRNQASRSYSTVLLSELESQGLTDFDDTAALVSGEETDYVHRSILSRVSPLIHNIISSSCQCQNNVLILPSSPPSTLPSIVALIYTGSISGITKYQADQVIEMAKLLGISIQSIASEIMENSDGSDSDSGEGVEKRVKRLMMRFSQMFTS